MSVHLLIYKIIITGFFIFQTRPVQCTFLTKAAARGDLDRVRRLIAAKNHIEEVDRFGRTALMCALRNGSSRVSEFLLFSRANPNHVDYFELSPLLIAVKDMRPRLIELLVKYGVDLNQKNSLGETPLFLAVSSRDRPTVQVLVLSGADVHSRDNNGRSMFTGGSNFNKFLIDLVKRRGKNEEKRFRVFADYLSGLPTPPGYGLGELVEVVTEVLK
jgi:hypothetical protein